MIIFRFRSFNNGLSWFKILQLLVFEWNWRNLHNSLKTYNKTCKLSSWFVFYHNSTGKFFLWVCWERWNPVLVIVLVSIPIMRLFFEIETLAFQLYSYEPYIVTMFCSKSHCSFICILTFWTISFSVTSLGCLSWCKYFLNLYIPA